MINYIRIRSKDRLAEQMASLATRLGAFWNFDQQELMVYYEPFKDPRTRSQNNLYWMWLEEMANHYSTRGTHFSKDDMHDLMRHQFLGYEDRMIGGTAVKHQLRSTAKLPKEDMSVYMDKIEAWNTNNGLMLTIPADNEYAKYREAQA